MFVLAKILGGRINVPEPHTITVTALSAAIAKGTPVNIKAGVVTPLTASTAVIATHLVENAAASGATTITVSEILPGMVFEAPLTAAIGSAKVYGEYTITAAGISATAAAPTAQSPTRGAILYDPLGASASGDKVLVTFPVA